SKTLPRDEDVLSIGINRAVVLLADAKPRLVVLGDHPEGGEVVVRSGRFGPYVQHGNRVANLPRKGSERPDMAAATLEEAIALLATRGKELAPKPGGKRGKRTTAAAKPAAPAGGKATRGAAAVKAGASAAKPKPKPKAKASSAGAAPSGRAAGKPGPRKAAAPRAAKVVSAKPARPRPRTED
ncbi:MAG: topoisomerase C-terminal repeat-containing protein, partial [Acetobacteraceae bacterium]